MIQNKCSHENSNIIIECNGIKGTARCRDCGAWISADDPVLTSRLVPR